jgi:ribonuclease D
MTKTAPAASARNSSFVVPSPLDGRHSSKGPIANASQLAELLPHIESAERVAVDTEADSLHCYREKLCLLQISVPVGDFIVDPLSAVDLAPLRTLLEKKEIVLQGADFDLRLLRRSLNFKALRVFDTVIAARLLGIREFSLAALVKRFFDVELTKGSQKANWAQRPLPARMLDYAVNDTHYLLPLADKLEAELQEMGRLEWLEQSCQRAVEQADVDRVRDLDEVWRISGAGVVRGRTAAVLRELWRWREKEAEAADRPAFHILQNQELLRAADSFDAGNVPDYHHFSARRRRAFREAAERGLQLPEEEWPIKRRRFGVRPTAEIARRIEQLRQLRDTAAKDLGLEPSFLAPKSTLESIATEDARAGSLLVPWQRELLRLEPKGAIL